MFWARLGFFSAHFGLLGQALGVQVWTLAPHLAGRLPEDSTVASIRQTLPHANPSMRKHLLQQVLHHCYMPRARRSAQSMQEPHQRGSVRDAIPFASPPSSMRDDVRCESSILPPAACACMLGVRQHANQCMIPESATRVGSRMRLLRGQVVQHCSESHHCA